VIHYRNQVKCVNDVPPISLPVLYSVFWMVFQTVQNLFAFPWSLVLLMALLPVVSATPNEDPFSGITFRAFSEFIEQNFSSRTTLTTVLVVLYTMTNNSNLLNLHARQQHPLQNECMQLISGWLKALAHALDETLGQDTTKLFQATENVSSFDSDQRNTAIATKLDGLLKRMGSRDPFRFISSVNRMGSPSLRFILLWTHHLTLIIHILFVFILSAQR
jgi:hypothetical protein